MEMQIQIEELEPRQAPSFDVIVIPPSGQGGTCTFVPGGPSAPPAVPHTGVVTISPGDENCFR